MGALTFDALLRSLKQGASDPVYYLHGDEDVLKDEAVRALVERAVDPAARDFNVDQRNAPELDAEAFHALVNTPPMLAATRAVVVRGLDQLKKTAKLRQELLRYLESPNPTTLLVLVQAAGEPPDPELVRRTTAVAVEPLPPARVERWMAHRARPLSPTLAPEAGGGEPLPPARVERWMAHRARQLSLTLAPEAGALLLDAVGSDLAALARELEKLAALAGGASRPATREDVAALVGVRRGETLQDLVDAALERRAADAAPLVAPVLEQAGMSGVRMLTALGTHLVGTALARAELDQGPPPARLEALLLSHLRAARPYGLGSWEGTAARWARWAGRWSARELERALRLARDAHQPVRSSRLTDEAGTIAQRVLSPPVLTGEGAGGAPARWARPRSCPPV